MAGRCLSKVGVVDGILSGVSPRGAVIVHRETGTITEESLTHRWCLNI
jgi:hypothetical protein